MAVLCIYFFVGDRIFLISNHIYHVATDQSSFVDQVIIDSLLWSNWWFRILIMLFTVGAIILIFSIRTQAIRRYNRDLQQINSRLNEEIKERQHAEAKIQQLNQELEKRVIERTQQLEDINKELETFTISVSHDLRAPLRSIESFAQILLQDYDAHLDNTGKDYLNRIHRSALRLAGLINDLLKLSRAARLDLRKENVNLSHIVNAILGEYHALYPNRQVECKVEKDIIAFSDPQLIRIVLQNLIDNAWKFTNTLQNALIEFGRLSLSLNPSAEQRNVYFIRDNGVGFDMKYYDKLFMPFQRLHKESEYSGAGIGLVTAKRILKRHGGTIWGESKTELGTTFYFQI